MISSIFSRVSAATNGDLLSTRDTVFFETAAKRAMSLMVGRSGRAPGPGVFWPGVFWRGVPWPGVGWSRVSGPGVPWPGVGWSRVSGPGVPWPGVGWSRVSGPRVPWLGVPWSWVPPAALSFEVMSFLRRTITAYPLLLLVFSHI